MRGSANRGATIFPFLSIQGPDDAAVRSAACEGGEVGTGRKGQKHESRNGLGLGTISTLTRICFVSYIRIVESVFEVIAEPHRRAILSLLVSSQQSVGEIERQLRMPQPTVSKHLRVLRKAGFVESAVDAQRRLYRLKPEPLQEVDAWLAPFRRFWSAHVDALERHLDRMDQLTPTETTTKKKQRGPKPPKGRRRNENEN